MSPARAHTEDGRSTVTERERMPNLTVLSELELTCDFEAVLTWVLGVESPNRYRVHELTGPPRLVVDVRHSTRHGRLSSTSGAPATVGLRGRRHASPSRSRNHSWKAKSSYSSCISTPRV